MTTYLLQVALLSDATFGRGDGLAGLLDQEVEHDAWGFPYLRGRTLKGLISEECDALVPIAPGAKEWNLALQRLFGSAGSTDDLTAHWRFGDAVLPHELRRAVEMQQCCNLRKVRRELRPSVMARQRSEVLDSLTTIRRQTAIDTRTGTPDEGSLRAARVVHRDLTFISQLEVDTAKDDDLMLLAVGVLALRHLGAGRNRGRGRVRCTLHTADGTDITRMWFEAWMEALQ